MNYTTNYTLNKPERNEQFNLDDWNDNSDKIDTAMNTNKTNIATNASNISTILTGLSTVNASNTSSVFYKLFKLIYPVGSIYWSSKSTNPSTLFGGTWTQIKDRFILARGDTYTTTGATGGASTVTLTTSNMPAHTHTFTPTGTFTMSAHTHSFTPSGSVSVASNGAHTHTVAGANAKDSGVYCCSSPRGTGDAKTTSSNGAHTHSASFSGTAGTTGSTTPTGTFTGTKGTTSSVGSGTAFSILPPYIVKYCWERTA